MRTKLDLVKASLQHGNIIASDEDPTDVDAKLVAEAYDAKLAEWRRRGFVWWENTVDQLSEAEIPLEVFPTLTLLMFNEIKGSFGVPDGGRQIYDEDELLKRLRRLNHKPPSGEPTPFSSF